MFKTTVYTSRKYGEKEMKKKSWEHKEITIILTFCSQTPIDHTTLKHLL